MDISTINSKGTNADKATPSIMDYELLAGLFMYPYKDQYKQDIRVITNYLSLTLPEAAEALQPFTKFTDTSPLTEIQELFLRSFDVQAITTLDIGFVLFGEDYKRGKLLACLNAEHKNANNPCQTELADHLPNLLRLLPKIMDESLKAEMATLLLLPAVEKMIGEFSTEKIEKKDKVYKKHQKVLLDSPTHYRGIYQSCLQALFLALKNDFGYEPENWEDGPAGGLSDPDNPASGYQLYEIKDFSLNIETEMLTEK